MVRILISALLIATVVAVIYRVIARGEDGLVLPVAGILAILGAMLVGMLAYGVIDTSDPDSYLHPWGALGAAVSAVLTLTLAHYFGRRPVHQQRQR